MDTVDQKCESSIGNTPALTQREVDELLGQLGSGWSLDSAGHLGKQYQFRNFSQSLRFAGRVGEIAEKVNHHPDLHVRSGQCGLEIWTHQIEGLTQCDFVLATMIEQAFTKESRLEASHP